MQTCTWAPTVFSSPQVIPGAGPSSTSFPRGSSLNDLTAHYTAQVESLGLSHLLIAQRWWGSGEEMEGSSLDCTAMTTLFAAHSQNLHLITAIHPGFFEATAMAKYGATLDTITNGRWSINVTSGWNMREFEMYGIDTLTHDARYERSKEFIDVLRGAWGQSPYSYSGKYYSADELVLEPRPQNLPGFFQGGQSDAAIAMAATHSDWMFLNGGSLERIGDIISRARAACDAVERPADRPLRFAMYAAPLCRARDDDAWAEIDARVAKIDPKMAAKRKIAVGGAEGMWASDDALSLLDTNEGYAARLIGSPDTIAQRLAEYQALGVEMLHFSMGDELFNSTVLPSLQD